jgi:hypothetical protein
MKIKIDNTFVGYEEEKENRKKEKNKMFPGFTPLIDKKNISGCVSIGLDSTFLRARNW